MKAWLAAPVVLSAAAALAQEVPIGSPGDPRVRYVTYRPDRSVVIKVRRGVVTRLILERSEAIKLAGTGFPSRCEADADEWCIRAIKGENQVWIKPKTGSSHNNLELATDKRDYSIKLEVLPDAPKGEAAPDEVFRAIFVYPLESQTASGAGPETAGSAPARGANALPVPISGNLAELGCSQPRRIVNVNYTRQQGAAELAPSRIFDDGAQTVFVYGDTALFPAVFAVDDQQAELRVNFSVDGNCLVVHQLGKRFVLRAGQASMHVFNEAYVPGASSAPLRASRERREVAP
jgi:type IV secretion system protein VirB9